MEQHFTQFQRWKGYLLVSTIILVSNLFTGCNKSKIDYAPFQLAGPFYPHLVNDTFPRFGSNNNLEEYTKRRDSICIDFNGLPVLEYGDEGLRSEDYATRSSLIVDGVEWQKEPVIVMDLLLTGAPPYDYDVGTFTLRPDPKTGEYLGASNAVGPFLMCWPEVYLDRGDHFLEFRIRRSSGNELGYRWSFSITE